MPRMAFSFPISEDAGFFAHYDVLYQRPASDDIATALDYYNFNDVSRINPGGAALDNPNLKPISTIDYEVGFQQKLSNTSALKVAAYYKEIRNLIQQRVYADVASPVNSYKSFDNIDFGTVKGFSFTLDRRRTNNLEISATYTLQFANGSGSDANSSNGINNRGPVRNFFRCLMTKDIELQQFWITDMNQVKTIMARESGDMIFLLMQESILSERLYPEDHLQEEPFQVMLLAGSQAVISGLSMVPDCHGIIPLT
jgi:hypothetical protein